MNLSEERELREMIWFSLTKWITVAAHVRQQLILRDNTFKVVLAGEFEWLLAMCSKPPRSAAR